VGFIANTTFATAESGVTSVDTCRLPYPSTVRVKTHVCVPVCAIGSTLLLGPLHPY
jgi:hypothetical protein